MNYHGIQRRKAKKWRSTAYNVSALWRCEEDKDIRGIQRDMKINGHKSSSTKSTISVKPTPSTCTFDKTEKPSRMGTCNLIRRLGNKGEVHRRSLADPGEEVAWWLEAKSGSEVETMVHVASCGAIHRQKQFGGNHWRGPLKWGPI